MTTSDATETLFRRGTSYTCALDDCHCVYRFRGTADGADLLVFRCEVGCSDAAAISGTEIIVSPRKADMFHRLDVPDWYLTQGRTANARRTRRPTNPASAPPVASAGAIA